MDRCIDLISQPDRMNSVASQSSNSGWLRTRLASQVLGGTHQADTEIRLPEAVDRHPGGQRVERVDEPFGQPKPVPRGRGRQRGQAYRRGGIDFLSFLVVLAADQNVGLPRFWQLGHDHHNRQLLLQLASFTPQPRKAVLEAFGDRRDVLAVIVVQLRLLFVVSLLGRNGEGTRDRFRQSRVSERVLGVRD